MAGAQGAKRAAPPHEAQSNEASRLHGNKRPKRPSKAVGMTHSLLERVYPNVQTLRKYLISQLPSSSRLRRKKITSFGLDAASESTPECTAKLKLCHLLDTAFVAFEHNHDHLRVEEREQRWGKWTSFSQKGDESYVTLSDGHKNPLFSQSEIVDFVIWLLFSRKQAAGTWPKHLLCDGYRRNVTRGTTGTIPGVFSLYPNQHVQMLKETPWPQLLVLLGKAGERIMIDLLTDCAVFTSVEAGCGNLFQISGLPISELDPKLSRGASPIQQPNPDVPADQTGRNPSEIVFAKARMLYARAALNAHGQVQFGLRHIHVLNRCQWKATSAGTGDLGDKRAKDTTKVMMYIFPRQFGLHNVFTSTVDHTQTAQKLQDYTLREDEINALSLPSGGPDVLDTVKTPKRLRGKPFSLTQRLQVLHSRCAYTELLRHYCPTALDATSRRQSHKKPVIPSTAPDGTPASYTPATGRLAASKSSDLKRRPSGKHRRKYTAVPSTKPTVQFDSLADVATPIHEVSAFCQAVLSRIIPREFWSASPTEPRNHDLVMKKVDHFVRLRRFESMSLSEVREGLKVTDMAWLVPPHLRGQKSSASDTRKRLEILDEFLYYVFDSILIPLIRSNFYVTESNAHRYKLFFFRHDIWRHVAEPAMAALKVKMFEEVKLNQATRILSSRKLGFSQIRLLPKGTSMRPIANLRRRTVTVGNKKVLQPSINSILGPLHAVLALEKKRDPSKLGASLFSVPGMYEKLKAFREQLGPKPPKLYFVKVDVKSAFDTIPQESVLRLMNEVISLEEYRLGRHAEVKAGTKKLVRRWQTTAAGANDSTRFTSLVEKQLAVGKKHTIFIDNVMQKRHDAKALAELLASHVQDNLVKIGKRFYRQKEGIPQGSVLSSTLCNYFYGDLERQHLSFLNSEECLLLRLIDDFLLVTTDVDRAQRFVDVMHGGLPDYGVTVNPAKTLINFAMKANGVQVATVGNSLRFPYCGTLIDCKTLSISKAHDQVKDTDMANALTVEFGRVPGQHFRRKVLNAFKIQSHVMFFDTSFNSPGTVSTNLFEAFAETATKMWAYTKCLPTKQQPSTEVVIDTVLKLVDVAHYLLTSKSRKAKHPTYVCAVSKAQIKWLAVHAIRKTLLRRQTRYREVVVWLGREAGRLASKKGVRDVQWMQQVTSG